MRYRTVICVLLFGVVGVGCGQVTPDDAPATRIVETPVARAEGVGTPVVETPVAKAYGTATQADDPTPQVEEPAPVPPPTGGAAPSAALPPSPYVGDSLIEEKIISYPVIVKATMTSFSSDIMLYPDNTFRPVLEFKLSVSEYLKGTGPSSIVAVWFYGRFFVTSDEANSAKAMILAERDDQWDDSEAIFFLVDGASAGPLPLLSTQPQLASQYFLGLGDQYSPDDGYSLHSKTNKRWLPAAAGSATGDSQEFLLDVPPTSKTITLGNLKTRITEVTAEFNGGDGSQTYRDCVVEKYRYLRNQRNFPEEMGRPYTVWNIAPSLVSGQPAGAVLDQREAYGGYPDTKITLMLEGSASALFDIEDSASTPVDRNKDGVYDAIKYDQMVILVRPIPVGEYRFDLKEPWRYHAICNFIISNEWTVTVTAPDDTLHELFFDPVTVGSNVAADGTNGVLKPATFTDSNGASATVESISYESGTVKVEVTPDDALAGQVVDFIELDGTVSLSLDVADATVDAGISTLRWSVSSQPWEDGDMLMVRMRRAR